MKLANFALILSASIASATTARADCDNAYQLKIRDLESHRSYYSITWNNVPEVFVPMSLAGAAVGGIVSLTTPSLHPLLSPAIGAIAVPGIPIAAILAMRANVQAQIDEMSKARLLISQAHVGNGLELERFSRSEQALKRHPEQVVEWLRIGDRDNVYCQDGRILRVEEIREWIKLKMEAQVSLPGEMGA